jgi:hypothetical protein
MIYDDHTKFFRLDKIRNGINIYAAGVIIILILQYILSVTSCFLPAVRYNDIVQKLQTDQSIKRKTNIARISINGPLG